MREIMFRGINKETGEFVYGWYTRLQEGARRFDAIIQEEGENNDLVRYYIHDRKTIGQYTGLKDANGVMIFEGDIVEYRDYAGKQAQEVMYCASSTGFEPFDTTGEFPISDVVVIGNIHQNPELLP